MYVKEYLLFDLQTEEHHQLKVRAPGGEQFADTNKLVNRIVRLTIETGSLTGKFPIYAANFHDPDPDIIIASVAVVTSILSAIPSHPFAAAIIITSNLYATTLLVALNSRIKFRVESLSWMMVDQSELHDSRNRSSILRFNNNTGSSSPGETPPVSET